jgi:hypothetical protein
MRRTITAHAASLWGGMILSAYKIVSAWEIFMPASGAGRNS